MSRFEHTVTVDAPLREVYDQWTQFESFPEFMDGVRSVVQRDDKYLDWTADIGGQERTWTAEITDQTPDRRIAWKSIDGPPHGGAVLFEPVDADRTRLTLRMDAEPESIIDKVGDALGFLERRTKGDLDRFRTFIEDRGQASGGWRGEIHGEEVRDDVASR